MNLKRVTHVLHHHHYPSYFSQAQNPDELTIVENEQLEVVGEGDGMKFNP